ncbi:MAG: MFS transporter [Pseudomonadota bacterium]
MRTLAVAAGSQSARFAFLFGAAFFLLGVHLPFFPVWLEARGYGAGQISLAVAVGFIGRIVMGPLIAHYAQAAPDPRKPILALAMATLLFFAFLPPLGAFWTILALGSLAIWFFSTLIPLADVMAMQAQRAGEVDYGRMRAFGSVAFIVASLMAGWLKDWGGPETIMGAILVSGGVLVLASATLKRPPVAEAPPKPIAWSETLDLAARPAFLVFLLAGGVIQASHGVYYAFSSIHWSKIGYSDPTIGMLWGVGVAAEVAFLAFSGPIVARLGPARLLALAGAAATLRWGATAFDPPLGLLILLQALHALSFAATHVASVSFVVRASPERLAGAAMTLTASTGFGLAVGLAALTAGGLYSAYGAGSYLSMAALGAAGLVGALALGRMWSGETLGPRPAPA